MKRHAPGRRPAPVPRGTGPAPRAAAALAVAALVLLVAVLGRHVLGTYFALDDNILFQQARGLRPWPAGPWRWLSGWAWFHSVVPLWGTSPLPYHVANLGLHALNAVLLARLARRGGASAPAAALAAGLYAASRLHFTALVAASSVGELLALTLTLSALLVAAPGRRAAASAALFALALLAKESVLLVPLAALALPWPGADGAARRRALVPAAVTGLAGGAALLAGGLFSGRLAGEAYAMASPGAALANLGRLFGWSVDLANPIPDLRAAAGPGIPAAALVAAAVLAAGAIAWRGAPLVRAGALWWLAAALPVAPVAQHAYLHYLVTPLAGLALAAAGAFDGVRAMLRRRGEPGRLAWAAVAAIVLLHAAWSDVLLSIRVDARAAATGMPIDPVLRKSEATRLAVQAVGASPGGAPARVLIVQPASVATTVNLSTGRSESGPSGRWELDSVLDGGRSLRAYLPGVDSVEFAHALPEGHDDFDWFLPLADGRIRPIGRPPDATARVAEAMLEFDRVPAAVEWTAGALAARPHARVLWLARGDALARAGDLAGAREAWRTVLAGGEADSAGVRARAALELAGP
jgi:hypothetical protein